MPKTAALTFIKPLERKSARKRTKEKRFVVVVVVVVIFITRVRRVVLSVVFGVLVRCN